MLTDFSRRHYKLIDRMKASRLPASKLPRSTVSASACECSIKFRTLTTSQSRNSSSSIGTPPSSRDKPLPSVPVATIVPLSPASIHTSVNDESRPHSPSAASFSRVRRTSGLPVRSGAASPLSRMTPTPFRRSSKRFSNTPSTPDSYNVTDEELSGLHNVNRLSRDGRAQRHTAGYYRARVVDIPPSRKKTHQEQFSSSPPSASMHTSPLPTIHSQAVLPTLDFGDLHPGSPRSESNSITTTTTTTPPASPPLSLPPRSDSRAPLMGLFRDNTSHDGDDSSQYGYEPAFEDFTAAINIAGFGGHSEVGNGSPTSKGLVRNDSPMESTTSLAVEGATSDTGSISGQETEMFPEQKPADLAQFASQREQELTDHMEPLPFITTDLPRPIFPPQVPQDVPRLPGFGGLAGVNTPGKMRAAAAAREAMQKGEPNFARRTASSTAKSSAPPDIPRVVCASRPTTLSTNANTTSRSSTKLRSQLICQQRAAACSEDSVVSSTRAIRSTRRTSHPSECALTAIQPTTSSRPSVGAVRRLLRLNASLHPLLRRHRRPRLPFSPPDAALRLRPMLLSSQQPPAAR